MLLRLDDLVGGYVDVVEAVMAEGRRAEPRGTVTREVLAATIVIPADAPMLPVGTGRGVSPKMAAEEALQLIGGYSDAEALFHASANMRNFADQGAFHGAYGPRVRGQMEMVERRLREDPFSRRAVVTIWDPARDAIEGVKNYPCTTELQFMLRPSNPELGHLFNALDLHVTMRSNDAWHGFPYDAFFFNQLQHSLARALGAPVGTYFHHASSLHVYEEHWELTGRLARPDGDTPDPLADGIGKAGRPFAEAAQRARDIGDGMLRKSAGSEQWYIQKHAEVMGWEL
jgi:thymidylate synthase